jgi:UrcA family protein
MKSNLFRLTVFAVLGAFTLNAAVAGDAERNSANTTTIAVSYADLNMASPAGVDVLYRRIKSAAHKVCGVDKMQSSPVSVMRFYQPMVRRNKACVANAIDNAISDVNNFRLTHLHEAKLAEARQS